MATPTKPNILERVIAKVAPSYALERAISQDKLTLFGYDAAHPETRRGSSGGMAKNAGSETSTMAQDRLKVMWDVRDLERNMPIIRCVLDRIAQYVCGTIQYQSQTNIPELDTEWETYFQKWCADMADLTGRHNFRTLAELAFRSMLRDGDFGFNIVRVAEYLQLQCIESDRIGDPNKVSAFTSENYIQGITVDEYGRPVSYDIFNRSRKSTSYTFDRTIPADQFIFLSMPLRTDEYRGVSRLAPVIAQARDLYETFNFERGAAKWAASVAGVIRVTDPRGAGAGAGTWDGETADGTKTQSVVGNKLLRLKPNEDVTPFDTGSRPSGAFAALIDATLRDIAMGMNVPFGFFDMSRFGGATVRLEAMKLQRMFARFQEVLTSKFLDRIKNEVLNNGIAMGHITAPPEGVTVDMGRWQFGPHLTADTGYDTDANLSLLQNGLKTAASIASEEGYDYDDLVDALVKEAILLRDRCVAAGVPIEFVAQGRFPDATSQLAAVNAAMEPQVAPTIEEIGDGGVKSLISLLEMVANGTIPREEAVAMLVTVYGFTPVAAKAIVPEKQAIAVKANMPAPAAPAGKPASKPEEKTPDAK
jgi:lambda family phage portal protein